MINSWIIRDMIKTGKITFSVGDEVVCFHRKSNGHPRSIKDNISYFVRGVNYDGHMFVAEHSTDGVGFLQPIKIHQTYMIPKSFLRDCKLNSLLN
jgi:hypothetical protein